jgi:DNA polymerase-1
MDTGFTAIYYLDFSQIELRNQADYTLRVSGGDLNMCRAYMPFRCIHYRTGEWYNFKDVQKRKEWNLKQEDGKTSVWLMPDQDYKPWTPTDNHSETTHNALMELGYECLEKYKHYIPGKNQDERNLIFGKELNEKAFKMARYKGKIFNFMKNYGGGMRAAMEQLDLPEIAAKALIKGYEVAFPEVITYQDAIVRRHAVNGYVQNMYGRRYYLDDNNKAYKLANYCVQGTCADMLKECIIKIDKLLQQFQTRFIMNIHDELSFEVWQGEEFLIPQILEIMQNHEWHEIPIVADVEVTFNTWADKSDWKGLIV